MGVKGWVLKTERGLRGGGGWNGCWWGIFIMGGWSSSVAGGGDKRKVGG